MSCETRRGLPMKTGGVMGPIASSADLPTRVDFSYDGKRRPDSPQTGGSGMLGRDITHNDR